ncbi:MAG: AAA family ATPase [Actinomycetota bacterium]
MKLEKLHLGGFGIFCGAELDGLAPGLNVIEGHNEAGKSTTMEFIRALLFGFQTGHNAQRYEPVRGGSHGGWALARDRAGRALRLERRSGGGRAGSGTASAEGAEALPLVSLVRGADRRLYTNVFAFSLHELQSLESLKGDSLYGRIYAAGSGSGDVSLLDALGQTTKKADELFRPGGRERVLNKAVRDRDALRADVELLKKSLDEYNQARLSLDEFREQVATLREAEGRAREAVAHARTLEAAWPTWIDLANTRRQLADVPPVERFPADGVARLELLRAEVTALGETQALLRAQVRRLHEQYRAAPADPGILAQRDRIHSICAGLQAYTAARENRPLAAAERDRAEAEGNAALGRLGAAWSEASLPKLDTSIARQDEARGYRDRLLAARQSAAAAQDRIGIAEQTTHRLEALLRRAAERLQAAYPQEPPPEPRFEEKLRLLEEAQDRLAQVARGDLLLNHAEEQRQALIQQQELLGKRRIAAGTPLPWWPLALVFVVGALAVGALREQMALAAVVTLATLGLMVGWAFLVRREAARVTAVQEGLRAETATCAAQIKEASERAEKLRAGQQEHRAWLERLSAPEYGWSVQEASDVRDCTRALQSGRERRQAFEADAQIVAARREEWEASREAEKLARKQAEARVDAERAERTAWEAWLAERGLPAGASPETALSLFTEADHARTCFRDRDDRARRAAELAAIIEQYEAAVGELLCAIGWPATPPEEIPAIVRRLPGALEAATAADRDRLNLVDRARELAGEWRRSRKRARTVGAEIAALLEAGEASDEESFRLRAAWSARRLELEEHARGLERILESHSAPGEKRAQLEAELAELDREQLQMSADAARSAHADAASGLEAATRDEGKLLERLATLEKSEELTGKLRELRAREAELEEAAERWAVLSVTRFLLEKTRERFEGQRQPGVIRRAGEIVHGMTGGRYRSILAPSGLDDVCLEAVDHSRKAAAQWSRGTAEQLYLALRFAFIEDYCSNPLVEPLPVVMDDVLVHADGYQRLRHAAEAIAALAQEHQVLYFTCRPSDAELLAAADPGARRFRLEDGCFRSI